MMTNRAYTYINEENTRKARLFLTRPDELEKTINDRLDGIAHLRELVTRTSVTISDVRVVTSRNVSSLEDRLLEICHLEKEVDRLIDEMTDAKTAVREVLDMLPLNLNRVLSLIYISGLSRAEVARRMKASRTTVYRYQEQGIIMVEEILDSQEAA